MRSGSGMAASRAIRRAALLTLETLEGRRLFSAGAVDTAFGGGVVTTDFPGANTDVVVDSTRLASGKLLVVASSDGQPVLARYNANGSRDGSFGVGGAVFIPASTLATAGTIFETTSGELLIGGATSSGDGAIARYSANGILDTGFGSGGVASDNSPGAIGDITTVGPDIAAIVSGTGDFTVVKMSNGGVLDTGFGAAGFASYDSGQDFDAANAIAEHNGAILVSGVATTGADNHAAFVQFTNGGALDPGFNSAGTTPGVQIYDATVSVDATIRTMTVLGDGRIVGAGTGTGLGNDLYATRLLANGTIDTSFGAAGFVNNNFGLVETDDSVASIGYDAAGKLLLIG